jgi:glycosyltransferase involved in cell wall biosynthesis
MDQIFDWEYYIDLYPDLKAKGINNKELALKHWNKYGKKEGRLGYDESFDWEDYLKKNPDLINKNIISREQVFKYWIKYGKYEKISNNSSHNNVNTIQNNMDLNNSGEIITSNNINWELFDWECYLNEYPDLLACKINTKEKAIKHWIRYGNAEKRTIRYIKTDLFSSGNNKMISIVVAYYNRLPQTLITLDGFQKNYTNKYNFEVIIVDDNSNAENDLTEVIKKYSFKINLIKISAEEKGERVNPCVPYNIGFKNAIGDIVIIQNPECYHVGNILGYVLDKLNFNDYITFSCFSTGSSELNNELINSKNIIKKINDADFLNRNSTNGIRNINWYNHPTINKTDFHFCSAIYKENLNIIDGFSDEFKNGYCFDDDDLLLSIKEILKLNIITINPDNYLVIHQYHTRSDSYGIESTNDDNIIKKKWLKNKELFENKKNHYIEIPFNYPRILHLYWDGSNLSYLNLCTIYSFNEYHKYWKIIIHMPLVKHDKISWTSHEQKKIYDKKDFFKYIKKITNVKINIIDFKKIGFRNDASEVIKSDYLRYYLMDKYGGIWSDFDIIYTSSVEKKMNFNEEIILFNGKSYNDPKNKKTSPWYIYYPIGFFIAKRNTDFFKYILKECINNYNPDNYQTMGASLFINLFPEEEMFYNNSNYNDSILMCNEDYYLPWAWNEIDEFLEKKDNVLPEKNIGIHWFNGADKSKLYAIDLTTRILNGKFNVECYLDTFINKYINNINNINNINKKVSIVMAYYNKKSQLLITLDTIKKTNYNKNLIEVIIVDDCSSKTQSINSFLKKKNYDFTIKVIRIKEKMYYNPCYAYNIGFKHAMGDIIIIQNPEVMHVHDCIQYVVDNLEINDWLTFNCYGLKNFDDNTSVKNIDNNDNIFKYINNKNNKIGGNAYFRDDVGGWLNHYNIHFVAYHYFGAIHKKDLDEKMNGGFHDEYSKGICFDDNDFIMYLHYNKFNFKINTFEQNQPFVIHLYHERSNNLTEDERIKLWNINKKIYEKRASYINYPNEVDISIRDIKYNPLPILY